MSILSWLNSYGTVEKVPTKEETDLKDLSFRYLGLYFTATWCSYCVKLASKMPQLLSTVNSKGIAMKVITFRLDEEQGEFGYYDMRFKYLPYEASSQIASVLEVYQIPTLIVYDYLGRLVTRKGYQEMMQYKEKTIEIWDQKMQKI